MSESTQPTTEQIPKEENESDLDLSDVPMDEHEGQEEQEEPEEHDDTNNNENESEEFDGTIEEEDEYIREKLFKEVIERGGANTRLSDDEATQEPEEELDEEERLRLLMDNLDPIQMSRFEHHKRARLTKGSVKKLAYAVLNQSISTNAAIIVSGVGKVFVGEIVNKARQVKRRYDKANYLIKIREKKELNTELKNQIRLMKEAEEKDEDVVDITPFKTKIDAIKEELKKLNLRKVNENGPLQPEHIREAWRLYQVENHSVPGSQWRRQGERDGMMFR